MCVCDVDFLVMILFWCIFVVIIMGNMFIFKFLECDFGVVMIFVEFIKKVGFFEGVVNIVYGVYCIVNFIFDEFVIKVVSFVGGNKVGEYIFLCGFVNGKCV